MDCSRGLRLFTCIVSESVHVFMLFTEVGFVALNVSASEWYKKLDASVLDTISHHTMKQNISLVDLWSSMWLFRLCGFLCLIHLSTSPGSGCFIIDWCSSSKSFSRSLICFISEVSSFLACLFLYIWSDSRVWGEFHLLYRLSPLRQLVICDTALHK